MSFKFESRAKTYFLNYIRWFDFIQLSLYENNANLLLPIIFNVFNAAKLHFLKFYVNLIYFPFIINLILTINQYYVIKIIHLNFPKWISDYHYLFKFII